MAALTLSTTADVTQVVAPTSLVAALDEVSAKRDADLIRFRTCCADPRASK
jgi:hypothetical protein